MRDSVARCDVMRRGRVLGGCSGWFWWARVGVPVHQASSRMRLIAVPRAGCVRAGLWEGPCIWRGGRRRPGWPGRWCPRRRRGGVAFAPGVGVLFAAAALQGLVLLTWVQGQAAEAGAGAVGFGRAGRAAGVVEVDVDPGVAVDLRVDPAGAGFACGQVAVCVSQSMVKSPNP